MTVTTARKLSADDLLAMGSEGERYELDDGELIELPPAGPLHGKTENEIAFLLTRFVRQHRLGEIWTGDVGFKLLEDRVRAPDVAFISRERLRRTPPPKKGFYPGSPDLAVEVLSPEDSAGQVLLKVSRFITAGTRLVWVVDPQRLVVTVYRANGEVLGLKSEDELLGEDVLPGFSCRVADLFPPPLDASSPEGPA
jgi:Uma2 family endonuclease